MLTIQAVNDGVINIKLYGTTLHIHIKMNGMIFVKILLISHLLDDFNLTYSMR